MEHGNRLAALAKVTRAMTSSLDLDVVLDTIAVSVVELLSCDAAAILLLDENKDRLFIRSSHGLGREITERTCDKVGENIAGRTVAEGRTIVANDLPNDPRFDNPWNESEGLVAIASAPLKVGQEVFGTLDAHSKSDNFAFDQERVGLLEMLACQASIAIEHARLYTGLRHARDMMEGRVKERTRELEEEVGERRRMEQALADERNMLQNIMSSLPDIVYVKDRQAKFLNGSKMLIDVMGAGSHENLVGKSDFDFYPQHLAQEYYEDDMAVINTGEPLINHVEPNLDHVTGEHRWLLTSKIPFTDQHGRVVGLVGIGRDITERKRAQDALQQRNDELRLLNEMGGLLQGCLREEQTYQVVRDICGRLFFRDAGCLRLLDETGTVLRYVGGWGEHEAVDEDIADRDCLALSDGRNQLVASCGQGPECRYMAGDHASVCASIGVNDTVFGVLHMHLANGRDKYSAEEWSLFIEPKLTLVRRVTDYYALYLNNIRLRETLRKEAIRDSLTGLYNRRHMEAYMEREEHRYQRYRFGLSVVMLDIDHFKRVNDTYGHEAGDKVLEAVGEYLLKYVRGGDLACRYGGEEFLLVMSGATAEDAAKRAEDIRKGIAGLVVACKDMECRELALSVTLSAGVASLPGHGSAIKEVITAADKALFQAKAGGRDRLVVAG